MKSLILDDGNTTIPGGLQGEVTRVVVIGAGIAGLTAANALVTAGVEVMVLEARDRLGGRLYTKDVGGTPLDFGGSWIHNPEGNPLTRWADHIGLERLPGNPHGRTIAYDFGERRRLSGKEIEQIAELAGDGFTREVKALLPLAKDPPRLSRD